MSSRSHPDPQLIAQLKALGISENTAKYALTKCKNDVQRAADFAFSGAADKDEVSNKNKSKKCVREPPPLNSVPEGTAVHADGGQVSPRSHPVELPAQPVPSTSPDPDDELEILVPSPNKGESSSLPSGSSRRWSVVLGLGKLGRKRGSVSSNLDGQAQGDEQESDSRNITPASSTIDGDDDGDEETPRGRALSKEAEKTKNPMRRLTLTRSSSSTSFVPTYTTEPQSLDLDRQASQLIMQAFDRGSTPNASSTSLNLAPSVTPPNSNKRSSTSSALAALGLRAAAVGNSTFGSAPATGSNPSSPTNDAPIHQSKSTFLQKSKPVGAKSKRSDDERDSRDRLANRAPSPFFRARRSRSKQRARERSPEVGALEKDRDTGPESDGESVVASRSQSGAPIKFRPQASAYETDATEDEAMTDDSGDEDDKADDDYDGLDEDGLEIFDDETEANTVANAVFFEGDAGGLGGMAPGEEYVLDEAADPEKQAAAGDATDKRDDINAFGEEIEVDPLGEGPNVIVPPEPLFATSTARNQAKRKTMKSGLELVTSRPTFARDRCTITLTHGEPDEALEESGKRLRRYVVLSDISEESTYAVEWAIGTVARDGDEVFLVTVKEDESKVDPKNTADQDRATRLRVQKERQTQALLLVRQVTGLLQRTRLNITVTCQALHAKNARYMLLDLIDFLEPTMVIVGSRGLGKLKGILLGSTSHYLVQKSSVPVMVARRRLQRPLRKTNPANLRHSPRVSLASASIEKSPSSKQEDDVMDVAVTEGSEKETTKA